MSMGAYGPKTAMPRILRLMDRYDLKVGFYVPGWIIERYPALVEDIVARGHEVGHHGYLHEKPFFLKGPEEEEALLVGPDMPSRAGARRPPWSRTPSAGSRAHTFGLLKKHGLVYHEHDGQRSAVPSCDAARRPDRAAHELVNDDFMYFGFANYRRATDLEPKGGVGDLGSRSSRASNRRAALQPDVHPQSHGPPVEDAHARAMIQHMLGKKDVCSPSPSTGLVTNIAQSG
jgi:peptidoglycan/xylan/chitin deacetylase (PgdA/CDA1 family)